MLRLLALALALFPALAAAQRMSQDDAFVGAREAFRTGAATKLAQLASGLKGYPLEPYVEYWQIRLRLEDTPPEVMRDFLARNNGTLVAETARREWLKVLGKRQQWELFQAEQPNVIGEDADIACYGLQARLRGRDESALAELRPYWYAPRNLPDGCVAVAESLIASGKYTTRHVWDRVRLLLEAGQLGAAKRTINYLPALETPEERTLDAINANPAKFAERADQLDLKKRVNREMVMFAIARIAAKGEPEAAASYWPRRLQERFSAEEQAWVWAQLATGAAKRHMPEAVAWFDASEAVTLTDEQMEWRVRAALRAENWPAVMAAIDRMPPVMRSDPAWVYWQARALRTLGKTEEADVLFARIAGEHQFYGKLAAEELGRTLAVPPRGYAPSKEDAAEMAKNPGIVRALTFFRLDLRTDAVREWNWTLRGMDDPQLLAAADVARRYEIWDRAINTADRTVGTHDFSVRFLAPYKDAFAEQAKAQGLEDAWVLGLVRQESRFITNARSSAGAAGLMQLMPATAKWMAKKIGLKDFQPARVTDVDTNIALGTGYLKFVLDELDGSPVLAAAAYNAGPGRARRWKANRVLEGAIYAETIPFNETRDYVKKVMNNTVYYAALYGGDARPLKTRLGTIGPRKAGEGVAATITGEATVQ